ncbi:KOW motif-containing protein [Candidatus Saccharibacteria bacterium]|nr:KOW motif-containing protein [Candidatus Saccharibacteria bacterium]
MAQNLKSGDKVTIIAGGNKGKSGKIVKMDRKNNLALIEGIGVRERHVAKSAYRNAGKKDIHVGIHLSNLKKEGK